MWTHALVHLLIHGKQLAMIYHDVCKVVPYNDALLSQKKLQKNYSTSFDKNQREAVLKIINLAGSFKSKSRYIKSEEMAVTLMYKNPKWSPRGHIVMSLASKVKSLAFASKPTSSRKCPVLGLRTAFFFDSLKVGHGHYLLSTLPWKTAETSRKIY